MAGEDEEKKNEEEKDMELDLMAEAELLRLTRQFRYTQSSQKEFIGRRQA